MADDGSSECGVRIGHDGADTCGRPARWIVEPLGWDSRRHGEPPGGYAAAPELRGCDDHLVELLNGVLADGG